MKKEIRCKSLWVSDFHLGTKHCDHKSILYALDTIDCDNLFLVGDIVDGWSISRGKTFFPQEHVNILRKILSKAKENCNIYYIIGNHDDFLTAYLDYFSIFQMGNISVMHNYIYESNDMKILVTHGDLYDNILKYSKWLAYCGDIGYTFICWLNRKLNQLRKFFGRESMSFAHIIKKSVKQSVNFINDFVKNIENECVARGCNAVICGHIHIPEITINEKTHIVYMNTGDFIENCTCLIERHDGTFELLTFDHKKYKVIGQYG